MPRARKGSARNKAKKRVFALVKGHSGARRTQWRRVQEAALRAGQNQYDHRRLVKRDYRALWITRITAACKQRGTRYSAFINGLKLANIDLNRKMLSEIAIHDPAAFDKLVETATAARDAAAPAAAS
ncbi:MAG: 50S ribosomal protein L20 [Planctomycetota bacterium]